jgi:hypothetical protein
MALLELLVGIGLIILGSTLYPVVGPVMLFASFAGGALGADGLCKVLFN